MCGVPLCTIVVVDTRVRAVIAAAQSAHAEIMLLLLLLLLLLSINTTLPTVGANNTDVCILAALLLVVL
jgi:hypothetical protein